MWRKCFPVIIDHSEACLVNLPNRFCVSFCYQIERLGAFLRVEWRTVVLWGLVTLGAWGIAWL